ncbi:MAG: sulfatase-like hydrolase/transferase [Firmicutes bacterium]|nr:sulfatase-like hydrolase/transferase [Bacillota bacterium]
MSDDVSRRIQERRARLQAEKERMEKRKMRFALVGELVFLPLCVLYMELLFHISSRGVFTINSVLLILLYSAGLGLLLTIPLLLIKRDAVRNITAALMLLLLSIPFLVEFFILKAFKVLYNLKTIVNGAAGMFRGFMSETLSLVFSFSGIVHILLFWLPVLLYFLLASRCFKNRPGTLLRSLVIGVCSLTCFAVALAGIRFQPRLRAMHSASYSFQSAVDQFGLLEGVRLELLHLNNNEIAFEADAGSDALKVDDGTQKASQSQSAETSEKTQQNELSGADPSAAQTENSQTDPSAKSASGEAAAPKKYSLMDPEYSMLPIDFDSLEKDAYSSQLSSMYAYAKNLTPSKQNEYTGMFEGKNLILICAEAFSGYVIDEKTTPTLHRMATKGIQFTDFYQPASAGTTGGETEVLFGVHPMTGGASMSDATSHKMWLDMAYRLNGYYGMAIHANDANFYDRETTHNLLGYSEGFMGFGTGMEEYVTNQWPQSDLETVVNTFPLYADHQPFNIYYMTVSGHSLYTRDRNAMVDKNWERVEKMNLEYSDIVKGYIACNLELEDAMTELIKLLEEKEIADDTVVVICGDHFPYGLDDDAPLGSLVYLSELYRFEVTNYLQRDSSRLILWSGCLEDQAPIIVDEPVMSLDILPTLLNLFGCDWDSRLLPGRDVFSDQEALVFEIDGDWKTNYGTYIYMTDTFTPVDPNMTLPDQYVENVSKLVTNKLNYCSGIIGTDFYDLIYEQLYDRR